MAKRPQLSKGELTVLQAVWELGEGSLGAIFETVCRKSTMDYSTVQTYLRRLEAKRYLDIRRNGRNKIYRPKVSASKVIRGKVREVVQQLFDGEVLAMVNHLVRDHELSSHDLKSLRKILEELEASDDCS